MELSLAKDMANFDALQDGPTNDIPRRENGGLREVGPPLRSRKGQIGAGETGPATGPGPGGWGGVQGPEPGPAADGANLRGGCGGLGFGLRPFRGFLRGGRAPEGGLEGEADELLVGHARLGRPRLHRRQQGLGKPQVHLPGDRGRIWRVCATRRRGPTMVLGGPMNGVWFLAYV